MTYTDETIMNFGSHKGKKMANVPAHWFLWAWNNIPRKDMDMGLRMYIQDNMEVFKKEVKDQDDGN